MFVGDNNSQNQIMVAKKYLCNAPRQEVWDEKVEAMLKSMRGTMKQKRSYLRKTLKGLQDEQYVCWKYGIVSCMSLDRLAHPCPLLFVSSNCMFVHYDENLVNETNNEYPIKNPNYD